MELYRPLGGLRWELTGVKVHVHNGSDSAARPQVPQVDTPEVLLNL